MYTNSPYDTLEYTPYICIYTTTTYILLTPRHSLHFLYVHRSSILYSVLNTPYICMYTTPPSYTLLNTLSAFVYTTPPILYAPINSLHLYVHLSPILYTCKNLCIYTTPIPVQYTHTFVYTTLPILYSVHSYTLPTFLLTLHHTPILYTVVYSVHACKAGAKSSSVLRPFRPNKGLHGGCSPE